MENLQRTFSVTWSFYRIARADGKPFKCPELQNISLLSVLLGHLLICNYTLLFFMKSINWRWQPLSNISWLMVLKAAQEVFLLPKKLVPAPPLTDLIASCGSLAKTRKMWLNQCSSMILYNLSPAKLYAVYSPYTVLYSSVFISLFSCRNPFSCHK